MQKTSDPKTLTPTTDFLKIKEKERKEYVPEDPDSEPILSDSSLSGYDFYNDSKYKNI